MPIKNLPKILKKSEHVTDAQQASRLEICRACPYLRKRVGVEVCGLCSCVLELKTRLKDEYCPIEKWKKV
jgi:hypothetical protein